MGTASLETYLQITQFMAEHTAVCIPPDSWYLSIIGIAPSFQGQGHGAALIRPTLTQADRLGKPVYLETFTPRNMRFYQRMGFKEAGTFEEPGTTARYWVMLKNPTSTVS